MRKTAVHVDSSQAKRIAVAFSPSCSLTRRSRLDFRTFPSNNGVDSLDEEMEEVRFTSPRFILSLIDHLLFIPPDFTLIQLWELTPSCSKKLLNGG